MANTWRTDGEYMLNRWRIHGEYMANRWRIDGEFNYDRDMVYTISLTQFVLFTLLNTQLPWFDE